MLKHYYRSKMQKLLEFLVGPHKDDYIILSDIIGSSPDVQRVLAEVHRTAHPRMKIVLTYHSYIWEPALRVAEWFHLKRKQEYQNWLSDKDIEMMLYLTGFEVVKKGRKIFGLIKYYVVRKAPQTRQSYSVAVVVATRNEKGNIINIVKRIPDFGVPTELIFVEGHSSDGTYEEIERVAKAYQGPLTIKYAKQDGKGKGDAVRKGFTMAKNQVLMILDADLTVRPEDLPKFYEAIATGRGEFINGSRLVYPMEQQAMRFFNILGNHFFSLAFTWLLGQRIKDTLCGTKVLLKENYDKIAAGRSYFGDFDPFGDFDLLFGAAKLNLKIVEVPVRYYARTYGTTNISRWKHGWLLLKMTVFAARKIKFF